MDSLRTPGTLQVRILPDLSVKTILKWPITIADEQTIEMPRGAKILCVQVQNFPGYGGTTTHYPYLWALVESDLPKEMRSIRMVGTGLDAKSATRNIQMNTAPDYIGTFQINGHLVFHVFG